MSIEIKAGSRVAHGVRRALVVGAASALAALAMLPAQSLADSRSQAKRMYDRLTGTPPSPALLDVLAPMVASDAEDAAMFMLDPSDARSTDFYRVTLKNFATPWTNREQSVFAPLNDYTATVIGMVRDDVPFDQVLSGDILYVGNVSPAYSPANNDNYAALEDQNADLRLPSVLQQSTQSSRNGLPAAATAGVNTSRAASEAFFIAGTNRAMFRFTLLNHLCRDLEQVQDTSRPPDRIRQDVSRSPGGDSRVFLNNCIGCHSGMDPMAQAYAYYQYDEAQGRVVYTDGQVQPKYLINSDNFKFGYVTPDDHWDNRWRDGPNAALGWGGGSGTGNGAKSLGQELAASQAFAECQVEKVFRYVCFRVPSDAADRAAFTSIVGSFRSGYNLKRVFAQTAAHCKGD